MHKRNATTYSGSRGLRGLNGTINEQGDGGPILRVCFQLEDEYSEEDLFLEMRRATWAVNYELRKYKMQRAKPRLG